LITKKEFCYHIIQKAEQKFGKKMGELDVFYAPDVGVALEFLGQIEDPSTIDTLNANPAYLFITKEGKYLSYKEIIGLLPDDKLLVKEVVKKSTLLTGEELRYKLGERKFYRVMDAIESLDAEELESLSKYLIFVQKELETLTQPNPVAESEV